MSKQIDDAQVDSLSKKSGDAIGERFSHRGARMKCAENLDRTDRRACERSGYGRIDAREADDAKIEHSTFRLERLELIAVDVAQAEHERAPRNACGNGLLVCGQLV